MSDELDFIEGDRGEFRITHAQLLETPGLRGKLALIGEISAIQFPHLIITVRTDPVDRSALVRWRPHTEDEMWDAILRGTEGGHEQ